MYYNGRSFRTKWEHTSSGFLFVNETFDAGIVRKDSMMRIVLWDHDGWSDNDLVFIENVRVNDFLQRSNFTKGKNVINVRSSWIPLWTNAS